MWIKKKKALRSWTLLEFLKEARWNHELTATVHEKIHKAIEMKGVDWKEERSPQTKVKKYKAFESLIGMEDTIEEVVSFFKRASQGLEEKKQILYLLGPVGGGKSSLAQCIMKIYETQSVFVLENSPLQESVWGLINQCDPQEVLERAGWDGRARPRSIPSPWALLQWESSSDPWNDIKVHEIRPSLMHQKSLARVEPGDENTQDITVLVGKVDIRQMREWSMNDPRSYSCSGGLCHANQGILEFVEMFKAPLKVLHPLLTATQEGQYNGSEAVGSLPFEGIILAHSNESEWQHFKNNRSNEAFLDRICTVHVPYIKKVSDEKRVYEKYWQSAMNQAPVWEPHVLECLARLCVMSRLHHPSGQDRDLWAQMLTYDGKLKPGEDPKAQTWEQYRKQAGVMEGMNGLSTRWAFKVLSKAQKQGCGAWNLSQVVLDEIKQSQWPAEHQLKYKQWWNEWIMPWYWSCIDQDIKDSDEVSLNEEGQRLWMQYYEWVDCWMNKRSWKEESTGDMWQEKELIKAMNDMEKGLPHPKDFRNDVYFWVERMKTSQTLESIRWTQYEKVHQWILKRLRQTMKERLPWMTMEKVSQPQGNEKTRQAFQQQMNQKGYSMEGLFSLIFHYVQWCEKNNLNEHHKIKS